jgi:hypothetical protein
MNAGRIYLDGNPREIFGKIGMLQKIGMQLPKITELLIKLKESGFPARTDIVNMADALEEIRSLIRKNKD